VLDAIGSEFKSDAALMIAGMRFIVVSHSKDARRHADDPGGLQDRFFDMLFPLVLHENDASQLCLGNEVTGFQMNAPLQLHKQYSSSNGWRH